MNRWRDWWNQAEHDLGHARHSLDATDYEWAAFAAHQAAEKLIKATIMNLGGEPWGHLLTSLIEALPPANAAPEETIEAASRLDKHYLPTRYPNGFPEGYPAKLYTRGEAEGAIADAERILEFCRRHVS